MATSSITLQGIIGASGVSIGQASDEPLPSLLCPLCAWRDDSGKIHQEPISLWKTAELRELEEIMLVYKPYDTVTVTIEQNAEMQNSQIFSIERTHDNELEKVVQLLQQPRSLSLPPLGTFQLDRSIDCYVGTAHWIDRQIEVGLFPEDVERIDNIISDAKYIWSKQKTLIQQLNTCIVQQMLPLKNDTWLDDESPLTEQDLLARISIESVSIYEGGSYEFYYNDGDVFSGHWIIVSGDKSGPTDATLVG